MRVDVAHQANVNNMALVARALHHYPFGIRFCPDDIQIVGSNAVRKIGATADELSVGKPVIITTAEPVSEITKEVHSDLQFRFKNRG